MSDAVTFAIVFNFFALMIAKAIFTHSQIIVKRQGVRTGAFVKEYSLDFAAQSRSGFHPIIGSMLLDYLFLEIVKRGLSR